VLTDEPHFYTDINCVMTPKSFSTDHSRYKARALEYYRQRMRLTEYDWVLHLDEESVIDVESLKRCLEFAWYSDCEWGQGIILYNQHGYWKNPIMTVADAIRVGDDISRFHLQFAYFNQPIFGAHGSFLLANGEVENAVTWDLGGLTEDYEFAVKSYGLGYDPGHIPGLIREQSPSNIVDFMKQRRRWFVGIRRLPHFLPKLFALLWALGMVSLFVTYANFVLNVYIPSPTPRWIGVLSNFSFMVFMYMYFIG